MMVIVEVIPVGAAELAGTQLRAAQRHSIPGGAGSGNRLFEAVVRIVGILNPVDNGVLGIGIALPLGGKGDVLSQLAAESKRSIPIVPALEGIALPGGLVRGHSIGFGGHEHRGGIGAAVGIEGDPVALLHIGVEGDVGVFNDDGVHLVGQRGFGIPAGDALIGIHGEGNIRRDYFVGDALPGGADHASRIQEEHIVHRGEGRGVGIGGAADAGLCAGDERVTAAEPAGELMALLLGRGRSVDSLARLDLLGAHHSVTILEDIGVDFGRGVHDIHFVDIRPRFRLHIADGEGQFLGGLRGEGQELGSALAGEKPQLGVVGQERRAGDGAVHSGQGHIRAGLAGDGDGADGAVGERHLRTLRGFLLQVTADGVGHIGRLLLGGSLLGGCGGHGDLPDLFLVADRIGDGGRALGYTENLGNVLFAGVSFFRPDSGGGDIVTCPLAAVFSGSGQLDAAVHIHGGILGRLFLGLGFLNCGVLSLGVLSGGILSLGVLSLGVLSGGILSRGILSRGILSLGLLNYGFLSRRFLGFGFLSRRFLGFGFLNRRFLDLGFLSSRLHDGRLRLGDYRGGGAEREGVGGA